VANGNKAEQVRRHVLQLVDAQLRPHDKLPTERELAGELAVSRLTIRRVLDDLERERRVYRVQGAGTFVREPFVAKSLELTSFSEDMRQRGMTPGSRLLTAEEKPAGARIAQELALSPGDRVLHVARVRTADGEPICLEHSYIPEAVAPGLLDMDLKESLYELLNTQFRVRLEHATQTIAATVIDPDDARLLAVPAFSAAFRVERTGFDARGRPIERAESLYRADRYHYEITLYRGQ
jgi:GntR family transcriptional regulator